MYLRYICAIIKKTGPETHTVSMDEAFGKFESACFPCIVARPKRNLWIAMPYAQVCPYKKFLVRE